MACSKFIVIAVFVLALIFGTRWCIVTFYSATYVATDPRSARGAMTLATPTKQLSHEEETAGGPALPPFEVFKSSQSR
ncbi:MAG: hypothetical protein NT105_04975 [Verrucomicrobia bacterium]|nr:hypothetical protein [Verrucomicrobiota bacterium]